jgi:RNA polymerase sigma-70 factor (sigma-E family)
MTAETTGGPETEYREFVAGRAAPLHRTAYLLCGDWHLADDLVQETLAKTFRHWRKVRRADSPDSYVHRILINEANRHHRRRRTVAPVVDVAEHDLAVPDLTDEIVDRTDLLRALLTLPVRQRATVVLRYLVGMSERETAVVLKCSEGTVKSQTFRALGALKTSMKREESHR